MLALALFFIGCAGEVNRYELNNAEIKCKEHGGIDYIDTKLTTTALAQLSNNEFNLSKKLDLN